MRYLFPFGEIKKDCKLIIYGAGNVGKDYIAQIELTRYCNVVRLVDKKYDNSRIFSPVTICELLPDEFNTIIIAVLNDEVAAEIRESIIAFGVSGEKISSAKPITIADEAFGDIFIRQYDSRITVEQFIKSIQNDERIVRDYFLRAGGHIDYFHTLILELQNRSANQSEQSVLIKTFVAVLNSKDFSAKAELLILRILYIGNCFCSDFLLRYMKCIYSPDLSADEKLFLWQDATMMYLEHSEYLYTNFFTHKNELLCLIAQGYNLNFAPSNGLPHNCKRIVVTQILHPDYPPVKLVVPMIRKLIALGYEVETIDLSAFEYDSGNSLFDEFYRPQVSAAEFRELFDKEIDIYYPVGNTMKERFQDILDRVTQINPALIIDVSDEYSMLTYYFVKLFPVLYWPMKKPSSGAFFHKIILPKDFYIKSSEIVHHPFSLERCVEIPYFFEKVESTNKYSRSDFGISVDDIILVTVGNRISVELSNKLIDSVCRLLNEDKKVNWFIVGCDVLPYASANYAKIIGEQLRFIPYEENLPDLLCICDIYLNPNRIGGGTSIAWACQLGLAVVTPRGLNAGSSIIDDEYAVETEECIVHHIAELMNNKDLLIKNKNYCKERGRIMDIDVAAKQFKNKIDRLILDYYSGKLEDSV